jgi:hypothetical protein
MKARRLFLSVLLLAFIATPIADAAPKKIAVKVLLPSGTVNGVSSLASFAISGNLILILDSDTESVTNPVLRAFASDGSKKWELSIDSGNGSFASAIAADAIGNIWVAGASGVTPTPALVSLESNTVKALQTDPFLLDPESPLRPDLTQLTLWQVSNSGAVIQKFTKDFTSALLPTGISISGGQIGVIGIMATATTNLSFYINCSTTGAFSNQVAIGKSDAEIDKVLQKSDGSALLLGSSTSSIQKEKLIGKRDAFAISLSKSGSILQVLRSSNKLSMRTWQSATTSLFLGGSATLGKKREAVMTKFDNKFKPLWTQRFPAIGGAIVVAPDSKRNFSAFTSTAAIAQLGNWKPISGQVVILNNDLKGIVQGGYAPKGAINSRFFGFTPELGVILIADVGDHLAFFPSISR